MPPRPSHRPGRPISKAPLVLTGLLAPWRSGYAAACKAVYTGSIPVGAFDFGIVIYIKDLASTLSQSEAIRRLQAG